MVYIDQEFQVPKMEVLNLTRLFWAFHTAYIGEYLHFRYLKCLVYGGENLADFDI